MPKSLSVKEAEALSLLIGKFLGCDVEKITVHAIGKDPFDIGVNVKKDKPKKRTDSDERIELWTLHLERVGMPSDVRRFSYEYCRAMGINNPYSHIANFENWISGFKNVIRVSEGKVELMLKAIERLQSIKYTIASPMSLVKTIGLVKDGAETPGAADVGGW